MNFAELYKDNVSSVVSTLQALWCGEAQNDSQKAYVDRLRELIPGLFAPHNAMPVVQCMNAYKTVHSVSREATTALVGDLWTKVSGNNYAPYEHQYQSWKALLSDTVNGNPLSVCVTTGTGSGKTECFMLPLVRDLQLWHDAHPTAAQHIQALFLYPLNALMEDQKARLEQLLAGTDLTYTVYNGDLPEVEPKAEDTSEPAELLRRNIEALTGGTYQAGELTNVRYPHFVYTRQMVRKSPPNILLTNPTMLEYILLRGSDKPLISPTAQSLRWVVIDETHTYNGAGAAELALLLRRVLLAFNVEAKSLRFATSSATFGNGDDAAAKSQELAQLKTFIANISGVPKEQIAVIDGVREGQDALDDEGNGISSDDRQLWRQIFAKEYVSIDELFPKGTIYDKLQSLEALCAREEQRCTGTIPQMKVKLHVFYRVPNNGLFIRLNEHNNGAFTIYTDHNIADNDTESEGSTVPLLELCRCRKCGEYVAVGRVDETEHVYEALQTDDSDMFDLVEDDDTTGNKPKTYIFALSKDTEAGADNIFMTHSSTDDNGILPALPHEIEPDQWHLIANTRYCCPYCHHTVSAHREADKTADSDEIDLEEHRLYKFRTSAEFISRLLAPSTLAQMEPVDKAAQTDDMLHEGQQYLSFVDSRQAAARATLKQNVEQEKLWVYSTIYFALCRRQAEHEQNKALVQSLRQQRDSYDYESYDYEEFDRRLQEARKRCHNYLTWSEVAELIANDKHFDTFLSLFVQRTANSDELTNGVPSEKIKQRYVHGMMVEYLANRVATMATPETMGFFRTCYPQLDKLRKRPLPKAVETFNALISNADDKITKEDWQHLLQLFLDHTVRSNQSYYLKLPSQPTVDIYFCQRFATEKMRRRPATKPVVEHDTFSTSRYVRYLCTLLDRTATTPHALREVYTTHCDTISHVIDALWDGLIAADLHLLTPFESIEKGGQWKKQDNQYSLNCADIAFCLYHDVHLCEVTTHTSQRHNLRLRPIENTFKGFSPYLFNAMPVPLDDTLHEVWTPFPYYAAPCDKGSIDAWAREHRRLLYDHRLWGDDGVYASRLVAIHSTPRLFVQAEHTAQVDKTVARQLQRRFINHHVNILACSTTMEMGVDLGSLELVLLTTVPPLPANYKQRAGRAGRNNKVRSACVTLCTADIIGLSTLYDPINKIIHRAIHVPTVDLESPQVVQRHVNAFLIRAFGVFTKGDQGGRLAQRVMDYYTAFHSIVNGGRLEIYDKEKTPIDPKCELGTDKGTMWERFNRCCSTALPAELVRQLTILLQGTVYDGKLPLVVDNAKKENERCRTELAEKTHDYATAYINAKQDQKKYLNLLRMRYYELLNQRLLNYWSTHRFTPNANMPVNVTTLDINGVEQTFLTATTTSNPSYPVYEAIAQYAPGNTIVVDGVAYIVRGIDTSSIYQGTTTFKKLYHDNNKTVVDNHQGIADSDLRVWKVNNSTELELIQPAMFIPDKQETRSRIADSNVFTHVAAQLIGQGSWDGTPADPHLITIRPNLDTGEAKILYYNEGIGYGYCYCSACGRTAVEDTIASSDATGMAPPPRDFNPVLSKDGGRYHHPLRRLNVSSCIAGSQPEKIRRNVIIGDLIQTDYAEIRIRLDREKNHWLARGENDKLLYTLGIVITQAHASFLGKERSAIDFTIMQDGHICIFDTNPGGAGYANQLAKRDVSKQVLIAAESLLREAKEHNSKDMLLDKFTLRYLKYVDIDAALSWVQQENSAWDIVPDNIAQIFRRPVTQKTLTEMTTCIAQQQHAILFITDDYNAWDYDSPTLNSWTATHRRLIPNTVSITICILHDDHTPLPQEAQDTIQAMQAWVKKVVVMPNPFADKQLYPIAYLGAQLFFTNDPQHATLNARYADTPLFCTNIPPEQ